MEDRSTSKLWTIYVATSTKATFLWIPSDKTWKVSLIPCKFYFSSLSLGWTHCLKTTQNVSFFNFGIYRLSGNTVRPYASIFQKLAFFCIFNELLSTQNEKVARFARNDEWDFFYDFQTMWVDLNFSPFRNLWSPESNLFSLEVSCPQNQLFALSLGILELSVRCLDRYSDTNVNMDIEVFCASIRCRKKDYILYYTQWRFVLA